MGRRRLEEVCEREGISWGGNEVEVDERREEAVRFGRRRRIGKICSKKEDWADPGLADYSRRLEEEEEELGRRSWS